MKNSSLVVKLHVEVVKMRVKKLRNCCHYKDLDQDVWSTRSTSGCCPDSCPWPMVKRGNLGESPGGGVNCEGKRHGWLKVTPSQIQWTCNPSLRQDNEKCWPWTRTISSLGSFCVIGFVLRVKIWFFVVTQTPPRLWPLTWDRDLLTRSRTLRLFNIKLSCWKCDVHLS